MNRNRKSISGLMILLLLGLLIMGFFMLNTGNETQERKYYEVIEYLEQGDVAEFVYNGKNSVAQLTLTEEATQELREKQAAETGAGQQMQMGIFGGVWGRSSASGSASLNAGTEKQAVLTYELAYLGEILDSENLRRYREIYAEKHDGALLKIDILPAPETSVFMSMLPVLLLTLVMMGGFYYFMYKQSGGGGTMGVGRARVKDQADQGRKATFKDVAGADEEKEELQEIVEFLKNQTKFNTLGARIPHGVLLVGPPGTGKTLLARACAGEAGVPFYSISGSDFVEMYVGVGASRVRDLFDKAKKTAPCIVFIDEIDAVGRQRGAGLGGGHDEREQTLNQLLVEMDGFASNEGVIVLAATNRQDILDPALLRPGRFDRRITIDRPNLAGRIATLEVHTRNIKLGEDVNLKKVALATAGCVGADLANLVNEAALRAVRKGRKLVSQEDMLAAFELVIAGTEKKGSVLTEFEKKLVAYHEVGHAMVAYKQKNTEPVQKITIVPHTQGSLGYTLLMPEEDKTELRTKEELMAKITVSMGGRAAEEVVMDTMTNGASQDIQDATNVARNMVAMFGMSEEFGMMALASRRNQYLDGGYGMDCAQDTAARMDKAVKVLLDEAYKTAVEVIRENREDMDKVVAYLLEKETITGAEMVAIIEGRDPALVENPYASTRRNTPEIEPAAKKVHMISEKIVAPELPAGTENPPELPAGDTNPPEADSAAPGETREGAGEDHHDP